MSAKQVAYEKFLDEVERRENAAIEKELPAVLNRLVEIIKAGVDHPNWTAKSLPTLRDLWKRQQGAQRPKDRLTFVESMVTHLCGWSRVTGKQYELKYTFTNDSRSGHDPHAVRIQRIELKEVTR